MGGNVKIASIAAGALALALVSGCASIVQGTSQEIAISSVPSGATVTSNGVIIGKTPLVADLRRKSSHILRIELQGYEPYEIALARSISGWAWGNIVFGGVIGLVVDFATGGIYKLTPEQIEADLRPAVTTTKLEQDAIVLHVVLEAKPEWEKIGQIALAQ